MDKTRIIKEINNTKDLNVLVLEKDTKDGAKNERIRKFVSGITSTSRSKDLVVTYFPVKIIHD